LAKEKLLKQEHPPVWSDFIMEVVDRTILMSDFGFPKRKKWKLVSCAAHLCVVWVDECPYLCSFQRYLWKTRFQ